MAVDTIVLQLKRIYGERNVFHDLGGSIKPGELFPAVIRQRLKESDAVLVVIGPNFLNAENASRLAKSDDPVRLEIEMALVLGAPVVPVTVEGAAMPAKDQLPVTLASLADTQALEIRPGKSFATDLNELAAELSRVGRPLRRQRQSRWLVPLAGIAISVAAGFLVCARFGPRWGITTAAADEIISTSVRKPIVDNRAQVLFVVDEQHAIVPQADDNGDGTYSIWISTLPPEFIHEIEAVTYSCDEFREDKEGDSTDNFQITYEDMGPLTSPVAMTIKRKDIADEVRWEFIMQSIKDWANNPPGPDPKAGRWQLFDGDVFRKRKE